MKKLTSMILTGLLCLGLFAGCGGNTAPTTPSDTTQGSTQYASALDLLTAIASGMTEEFPAAGGDEAHDTEGAGAYDIGTYGESFQYQILVDQALMDIVEPQAATLMHMMNTNTFCSAVMELKDGQDVRIVDAVRAEDVIICPECGVQCAPGSQYCMECGAELPQK